MVTLYYNPLSHPSRAVVLLAKAIDLPLEFKEIDVLNGETYTEEFLKMNPQHTVPMLVDGDFYLSESGAINVYLIEKYGKDDSLYPKDPEKRGVIHQRLLFLTGVIWSRLIQVYLHPVLWQHMGVNDLAMDKMDDAFNTLNTYLDGNDWVAGSEISVADYNYIPIISCAEAIGYDVSKYDNVTAWLTRCKETIEDYEELNQVGLDKFAAFFHDQLSKVEKIGD